MNETKQISMQDFTDYMAQLNAHCEIGIFMFFELFFFYYFERVLKANQTNKKKLLNQLKNYLQALFNLILLLRLYLNGCNSILSACALFGAVTQCVTWVTFCNNYPCKLRINGVNKIIIIFEFSAGNKF